MGERNIDPSVAGQYLVTVICQTDIFFSPLDRIVARTAGRWGRLPISQSSVILLSFSYFLPVSSGWLVRPFIRLVDFFYAAVRLLYLSPGRVEMSSPVRSTVKKEQESWWVHDWPTNKGQKRVERGEVDRERQKGEWEERVITESLDHSFLQGPAQERLDWAPPPYVCSSSWSDCFNLITFAETGHKRVARFSYFSTPSLISFPHVYEGV